MGIADIEANDAPRSSAASYSRILRPYQALLARLFFTIISRRLRNASSPIRWQLAKTDVTMERGMRPICQILHQTVFDGIPMTIVRRMGRGGSRNPSHPGQTTNHAKAECPSNPPININGIVPPFLMGFVSLYPSTGYC
jgi:hypothetical protein